MKKFKDYTGWWAVQIKEFNLVNAPNLKTGIRIVGKVESQNEWGFIKLENGKRYHVSCKHITFVRTQKQAEELEKTLLNA
jgi:hypothetical protein